VMCLDTDSGKVIWEYKFNMFQSDAPAHPVGLGFVGARRGNG
jgi:hypothetical protein